MSGTPGGTRIRLRLLETTRPNRWTALRSYTSAKGVSRIASIPDPSTEHLPSAVLVIRPDPYIGVTLRQVRHAARFVEIGLTE